MTKTRKIIIGVVIAAILIIGIGYAALKNITLNVSGSATANPDDSNFTVKLTGTPTVSDATIVTDAKVTDNLNATFTVAGLTAKGETATITYTIENASADLSANLSAEVTENTNSTYFKVTPTLAKESIAQGTSTTVTVEVELLKTPVSQDETSTIKLAITAEPVQP